MLSTYTIIVTVESWGTENDARLYIDSVLNRSKVYHDREGNEIYIEQVEND